MALFDQLLGAVTGGGQTQGQAGIAGALLSALMNSEGGIGGLLERAQASGLAETVQSWIGTGANLPISAESIQQLLGPDMMGQITEKTGLPLDQLAGHLSTHLPEAVDGVTPNGELPQGQASLLAAGAALLKSRFGIG